MPLLGTICSKALKTIIKIVSRVTSGLRCSAAIEHPTAIVRHVPVEALLDRVAGAALRHVAMVGPFVSSDQLERTQPAMLAAQQRVEDARSDEGAVARPVGNPLARIRSWAA